MSTLNNSDLLSLGLELFGKVKQITDEIAPKIAEKINETEVSTKTVAATDSEYKALVRELVTNVNAVKASFKKMSKQLITDDAEQ